LVLYFWQKEGFLKIKNQGGHSSFVFPHLCMAKSKVCSPFLILPTYNNYFPKKEGFLEFIIVYNIKIQKKCTID